MRIIDCISDVCSSDLIDSASLRRLAALLPPDSKVADLAGARLKLSNKARKRLVLAHDPAWADICKPAELAYRIGRESATDRLLLDTARPADEAASLKRWEKPVLPIGGGVLVQQGLRAGPDRAGALQRGGAIWIDETRSEEGRVGQAG